MSEGGESCEREDHQRRDGRLRESTESSSRSVAREKICTRFRTKK